MGINKTRGISNTVRAVLQYHKLHLHGINLFFSPKYCEATGYLNMFRSIHAFNLKK